MQSDDEDNDLLPEELELPDGIMDAEQAVEVLRAWVADGGLHVIFDPETFRHDVGEWGRMLADIALHVANAVEMDRQMTQRDALSKIHDAFDINMQAGDVSVAGRIKGRTEH